MLTFAVEMITGYQRSLLVFNLSHWQQEGGTLTSSVLQNLNLFLYGPSYTTLNAFHHFFSRGKYTGTLWVKVYNQWEPVVEIEHCDEIAIIMHFLIKIENFNWFFFSFFLN